MDIKHFRKLQAAFLLSDVDPEHLILRYAMLDGSIIYSSKRGLPLKVRLSRFFRNFLVLFKVLDLRFLRFVWSPKLKHVLDYSGNKIIIVWAVGDYTKAQLEAQLIALRHKGFSDDNVPVLLTNCADFAFYSRLGWLVEYLPALGKESESYVVRKLKYLAWRYKDAEVISIGL